MRPSQISCHLCDKDGRVLSACDKYAIRFKELTAPDARPKKIKRLSAWEYDTVNLLSVCLYGYVAVSLDGQNFSAPIPFEIHQQLELSAPEYSELCFTINEFMCEASLMYTDYLRIVISVEYLVRSFPGYIPDGADRCARRALDGARLLSTIRLLHRFEHPVVEVLEYNAISDGRKRVYTNADNLKEYGGGGIPSPHEVSYYSLYVNGVLQPKANYIVTKGRIEFVTADIPSKGETVLMRFFTFDHRRTEHAVDYIYYAVSDGKKRVYTNADEVKEYGSHGIPGPGEVSCYNLFVNGVLQPKSNYKVEKGVLVLQTCDVPPAGQTVTLESIMV